MNVDQPFRAPEAPPSPPPPEALRFRSERLLGLVAGCVAAGGAVGTLAGLLLGTLAPGYYRTVFPRAAESPNFDPISTGVGLGLTQGMGAGFALGILMVIFWIWYRTRVLRLLLESGHWDDAR